MVRRGRTTSLAGFRLLAVGVAAIRDHIQRSWGTNRLLCRFRHGSQHALIVRIGGDFVGYDQCMFRIDGCLHVVARHQLPSDLHKACLWLRVALQFFQSLGHRARINQHLVLFVGFPNWSR